MTVVYDDKLTEGDLLEELASELRGVELLDTDITVARLRDAAGCSESAARDKIKKAIEAGRLRYVGECKVGQARTKVYRRA